jgi:hypothetical protein
VLIVRSAISRNFGSKVHPLGRPAPTRRALAAIVDLVAQSAVPVGTVLQPRWSSHCRQQRAGYSKRKASNCRPRAQCP